MFDKAVHITITSASIDRHQNSRFMRKFICK
jgi:hypothetical protein